QLPRRAPGGDGLALPRPSPLGEAGLDRERVETKRGQPACQILSPDRERQEATCGGTISMAADCRCHGGSDEPGAAGERIMSPWRWWRSRAQREDELEEEIQTHLRMAERDCGARARREF